jgi:hypothetical protein
MASAKFKALVHQIVDSCEDPHRLGATKLNKICWYADTIAYRFHGRSITGETYVKRKHGPVPKSILPAIRELEEEGKTRVRDHTYLPSKKVRLFVSLKDADPKALTQDERVILAYVIDAVCNHHTAASISQLSHDAIWDAANEGEEIPLAATLVAEPAQLTPRASEWGLALVKSVIAAAA